MEGNKILKSVIFNKDLRNKVLAVFFMVLLYRVMAHVPIPFADAATLSNFLSDLLSSNRLFGLVDLFSGGAVANFSIALMGLGPYINSSIIMQILTQVVPKFSELKKEGEEGRRKINQYTRYLALPLAIGQSIGTVFFIRQLAIQIGQTDIVGNPSLYEWALMITVMVGGSMLLMWMGELISEKGVGNGISILIAASIIAQLPGVFGQAISIVQASTAEVLQVGLFVLASLVITYYIVKLNEARRTVKVSYAKRMQSSGYGGVESELPIRILTAGVIPIIFAVAFLSLPAFVGQIFANADAAWLTTLATNLTVWFDPSNVIYAFTYFGLVIAFTYFYTGIVFNPTDIAENLQKQGGFIPGIRPGKQTEEYLRKIVNRITLFGSISLGFIAVLPFIGEYITGSQALTFGGTGLLIVVSVSIESLRQIDAQIISASYK
ncbi:MAG: preprotein translocase subunit SecY [Candidatus Saccharimonadales bacterium]